MSSHPYSTVADAKGATRLSAARRRQLEEDLDLLNEVYVEAARAVANGGEWARPHLIEFDRLIREIEQELGYVWREDLDE